MNGNFADEEGIVRNSAGTLLCIIVLAAKDIGGPGGGIELARPEELHVPVVETVKGQIDITSTVNIWYRKVVIAHRLSAQESCTIGEGIGCFGRWRYGVLGSNREKQCRERQREKSNPAVRLRVHDVQRAE